MSTLKENISWVWLNLFQKCTNHLWIITLKQGSVTLQNFSVQSAWFVGWFLTKSMGNMGQNIARGFTGYFFLMYIYIFCLYDTYRASWNSLKIPTSKCLVLTRYFYNNTLANQWFWFLDEALSISWWSISLRSDDLFLLKVNPPKTALSPIKTKVRPGF